MNSLHIIIWVISVHYVCGALKAFNHESDLRDCELELDYCDYDFEESLDSVTKCFFDDVSVRNEPSEISTLR